jgi:hypothetical protein
VSWTTGQKQHALRVTLASTEAAKVYVRHVYKELSKIPKENQHAKNVQSTRISLEKASLRKRIAKNVATTKQQEH